MPIRFDMGTWWPLPSFPKMPILRAHAAIFQGTRHQISIIRSNLVRSTLGLACVVRFSLGLILSGLADKPCCFCKSRFAEYDGFERAKNVAEADSIKVLLP